MVGRAVNNINRITEVTRQLRNRSIMGRGIEVIGPNDIGYTDFWHAVRHGQLGNPARPTPAASAVSSPPPPSVSVAKGVRHLAAASRLPC